MRRSPEVQKLMDNYSIGEAMSAAGGDGVREVMRAMFARFGVSQMYEEILAGLEAEGHDANNPVAWQAAIHGVRHMGVREQVEQRMRRRA